MSAKRWPLAALAALFFGPFVVALLLYAGRDSFGGFDRLPNPDRELIENPPLVPLEALRLTDGTMTDPAWSRSRWSLIYARISPCGEACVASLMRLDEVYQTLGADRDRVQQLLLVPAGGDPTTAPADVAIAVLDAPELIRLLGPERLEEGRYFVVDPLGNVILSYPDDADRSRLQEDLERLLDVSRVG